MRIGVDARFLGGTSYGLAQYSESLLVSLSRHDKSNDYAVFVNAGLTRALELGPNFEVFPMRGQPLSIAGLRRLARAVRREAPDLLHVHFPLAPIFGRTPTIITVHDVVPFKRHKTDGRRAGAWDRIAGRFLYPRTMRAARWILCVSHATRDRLLEIFPEVFQKTIVLASGIDRAPKKIDGAAAAARARLTLPKRFVLYSGSSGESKNIPAMIEAFQALRIAEPRMVDYGFALDIIGDTSGLRAIQYAIRQSSLEGAVKVLTGVAAEDRQILFQEADALFMASKEEGFGFQVLKAQVAGVPVVAADAGALPEVVGEGALLVDPDKVDDMARMLGQALFDDTLRDYLIDRGRKNAARFSWDDTAKQIKQIYELLF